jgi:DNA repair protein RAD7
MGMTFQENLMKLGIKGVHTLVHLANGCRALQTLSLKICSFSDESVVAFISSSGNCLSDISLNNV